METAPWQGELPAQLAREFGPGISEFASYLDQNFLVADPEIVIPLIEFLKLEADFDYLVDITAVDRPERERRFELIYILYSFSRNERIRLKTHIADGQKPLSAVAAFPGADWFEREVFDLFGIEFAGHPNMKRILLPEEWEGHPLRRDHSITGMDQRWVRENLGIESGQ